MVDAANSVADAVYRLGFENFADSQASDSYVSNAELYQFADDAVKHLSVQVGIFIVLDASVPITAGIGVYNLPANNVFTILAWITPQAGVGGSIAPLRATPVANLFALDNTWAATVGESNRYSLDAASVGTITIYPIPITSGLLGQLCQQFPAATVASGSSQISALPTVLQDYLTYAMLAGGRGKESEHRMPEMLNHFQQRLSLFDQLIDHLWGPGQ